LKILFVIDTLGSGGKERRLTELLKALGSRQEINFELVVMSEEIHYREILDLGINIHKIIRRTKKDFSVFGRFYKIIKDYKPEIVHSWDSMTAFYVAPLSRLLSFKLINGMVIDSPVRQNIFNKHWVRAKLTFPFSHVVVGNSQAGLNAYRAPVARSIVIHNGFNFDRIKELEEKIIIRQELNIITDYTVGMVASFWEQKDYPTYFSAAQLLLKKRRDVTFLAIGNNTDSVESKKLVEQKNSENFRLLGKKTRIESYINVMDICILSTFTEGLSNAILEYMAMGKPVIATRGGGTDEIVRVNKTGFLVNPSSPVELAEKMEILLNDTALRQSMGLAGTERILAEFTIDHMVKEYLEIYAKVTLT
jgi:glycosyltransferase involved in cell wall biosynthesis